MSGVPGCSVVPWSVVAVDKARMRRIAPWWLVRPSPCVRASNYWIYSLVLVRGLF